MQLTFSEKASIMPQYATGNAAKEAGVRARFLFHLLFAFLFFRLHINAAHRLSCVRMDWISRTRSALKPLLLPFHVFDHYIVNFAQ